MSRENSDKDKQETSDKSKNTGGKRKNSDADSDYCPFENSGKKNGLFTMPTFKPADDDAILEQSEGYLKVQRKK